MKHPIHPRPGAGPPIHQPKKGAGTHGAPAKEKGVPRRGAWMPKRGEYPAEN